MLPRYPTSSQHPVFLIKHRRLSRCHGILSNIEVHPDRAVIERRDRGGSFRVTGADFHVSADDTLQRRKGNPTRTDKPAGLHGEFASLTHDHPVLRGIQVNNVKRAAVSDSKAAPLTNRVVVDALMVSHYPSRA